MATRNGKERATLLNNNLKILFYSNWLELFIRWLIGITFIYASYHKIVEPAHFAKIIYGYYLFPEFIINLCRPDSWNIPAIRPAYFGVNALCFYRRFVY